MTPSERLWDSLYRPDEIPAEWLDVLCLLPGYDPRHQAKDCRFDPRAAKFAIDFFPTYLKHVEGAMAGKPFVLEPWQAAWIANLFGWKRLNSRGEIVRRFRESLLYVPRKNGKSPLAAGTALLVFCADKEKGQQNYIAAGEVEQAGMLFRQCKGMLEQAPGDLMDGVRVYGGGGGQQKNIVREKDYSYLKVIAAKAETKHGGNSHMVLVDELHVQPNRDLVDVLTTSFASENRRQPLFLMLTTADYDRPSICNEKHAYACRVRDNKGDPNQTGYDPAFLPCIYEATDKDQWDSEETWKKCNPNLGVSVSLDYLRRECQKAKEEPSYEFTFRRLHLNQKTTTASKLLDLGDWDRCLPLDRDGLLGRECFGALDLSTTTDLTAFSLVFPEPDGTYSSLTQHWIPEANAEHRERRDRVPFRQWSREGWVTMTSADSGRAVDYDRVLADILKLGDLYGIREIACDRWNAHKMMTEIQAAGYEVIGYGQGYQSMNAPTKELSKLVATGKLRHGGNPVLRWQAANLAITQDPADNWKPAKDKSADRIDGMVSLIMGIGRCLLNEQSGPMVSWL